jgi:hypothetical protein
VTKVRSISICSMLYNDEAGLVADFNMHSLRQHRIGERRWQSVLIAVAICALTLSVATRFWTSSTSQSQSVKSIDRRLDEPKRQHLSKDATRWVEPTSDCGSIELPATIEARSTPADPLLPQHVFSDSLYNRPPPSSAFFL